ncbi:MAG: fibrobacter succinogenes major paralogous domain-containing protein [Prevotellaceae bacterium]|jgi:uncharacterized protein (TIGR02145 family)|nr:fibrobacter succinogenes major paralogous domain-containing protein [Prevotellaceae bacterium]
MKTKIFRKNKIVETWHAAFLLAALLLCPIVLSAQNGVTVSNLAVNAGTVTFNVSWKNTGMPAVWLDSAWVFVDYNHASTMKRLPLLPGATLTATSAPGTGRIVQYNDNNKGVWVVGNAKTATSGSFSATVKLLFDAVTNVAGACVYASNYPPEYDADIVKIKFTGTPMYEILLTNSSGETVDVKSGDTFLLPCDYTLTSFTDATGAPGIRKCTAPGSTVNFTAFDPCSVAPTGATWTLQDTRESSNNQNYKVKKMADGHIWMVQDLKFGDKCNKTSFTGSTSDQTGKVSSLLDKPYYGDCTNIRNSSTPSNRGYLYDWAAAINASGAYYGGPTTGCSGVTTGSDACQGLCPYKWHVPTYVEFENFMRSAIGSWAAVSTFWTLVEPFEGTAYGSYETTNLHAGAGYWTSTNYSKSAIYNVGSPQIAGGDATSQQREALTLRCIKNY